MDIASIFVAQALEHDPDHAESRMAKTLPRPGRPVRGSRSGRPVMALIDLIGRRWVLRIVWELRDRPLTFRALQSACGGLSPSVLNQRLADLRAAALVELQADEGYALSALGHELLTLLLPLSGWAEKWASAFLARGASGTAPIRRKPVAE